MCEGLASSASWNLLQLGGSNTQRLRCASMLLHAWASAQVQDLVAELARVRRNKIQAGLRELQSALSAVKLLNLGYMEVNQIRPFFKGSLDRFFRLLPACPHFLSASAAGFLIMLAIQAKVSACFALHLDLTFSRLWWAFLAKVRRL